MVLRAIFCIHECLFLCPGYALQAFTMVLAESYAVSFQHLLEEMNKTLQFLIHSGSGKKITRVKNIIVNGEIELIEPISIKNKKTKETLTELKVLPCSVDLNLLAPGTQYNIQQLVDDYKKLMICSQFHNQWIGAIMGEVELKYDQAPN